MFSGIVESLGAVTSIARTSDLLQISIAPNMIFDDLKIGDSVSVNGVCLTVTKFTAESFDVEIVPETLRLTNLNSINLDSAVNLERSLKVGSRNGGHNVQGHIDCMGRILSIESDGSQAIIVKIQIPYELKKYIAHKGYITVDGMSLTIVDVGSDWFSVTLIPHTQKVTVAHNYTVDYLVNIEVDILGKYIENFLKAQK